MKIITLLHQNYGIHSELEQFNVNIAPSKGVRFFGSNPVSGSMFIQFANGGTYIYSGITPEIRKGLWASSGIGAFVSKILSGGSRQKNWTAKVSYRCDGDNITESSKQLNK